MLRWLLEGKWLGHPLHSYIVHLPVGLYLISLLLDVVSYLVPDGNPFVRGAFYAMVFATLAALVALVPGLMDWVEIRDDNPAKQIGIYHMVLNFVVIAVYAVNISTRWHSEYVGRTPPLWLGMSVVGVVVLMASGYLGGLMVFSHGIGVGRHRRRGSTPEKTIEIDPSTAVDGMVSVAIFDAMGEGQSRRVAINGVVMAVARIDGQAYAFQEFCTHRFGPLSEGCFKGHEVQCPWHQSCFDMRTGKVTSGPAKEAIHTFPVHVRDGQIYVEVPQQSPKKVAQHQ
jgi:nitrite reductase/ring-hydroxylating ferredoxin subunit/uncharacterized membrane protein